MAEAGTVSAQVETGEAQTQDDGEAATGEGEGAWYERIGDDQIRSVAANFDDEATFLDALGFEEAKDAADWRETLDEDGKKFAASSPDIGHLVSRAVALQKKVSGAIIPPGKDADEATVAAYRKRIGVPETAEGYTFTVPEGTEVTDTDKAFQRKFAETFHSANITQDQAAVINHAWNDMVAASKAQQIEDDKHFAEESEAQLRRDWPGAEFDRNKTFAERAATRIFGEQLQDARSLETKDGKFVLDHPLMLRALAAVGREMAEGGLVPQLDAEEVEQIEEQIRDMRARSKKAQAEGDMRRANELYLKEQELREKALAGRG